MDLKIGISTSETDDYNELEIDGQKFEVTRGRREDKAIGLKELLKSLNNEIAESITQPCEVMLEVSGTTTSHFGGGITAFIINISGKHERNSTVKMILKFQVNPGN